MLYEAFEQKIEQEGLQLDPRQARAVQAMEGLFDYGLRVAPPPPASRRRRARRRSLWVLLRRRTRLSDGPPRDLYLCGAVGRGKTMLMDLFFQELARRRTGQNSGEKAGQQTGQTPQTPNHEPPQNIVVRFHFHAFMRTVHALLAQERQAYQGHRKNGPRPARDTIRKRDGLKNVARVLATQARLFCLDELEVKDVADALILNRLFVHLRRYGSAFIMTSNVPPRDLYRDGLQRELFLPFIDWLEEKADVLYLEAPCDYRLGRGRPGGSPDSATAPATQWLTPHTPLHLSRLQFLFEAMAMAGGEPGAVARTRRSGPGPGPGSDSGSDSGPELYRLKLGDRRGLKMARHGRGVLWTFFAPLCGSALGRNDYLTLASRFQTFFVLNIPRLTDDRLDRVVRFIWLIDILYDHGARLFATAEAPVHELYAGTRFPEFARTASRLQAMQHAVPLSSSPPDTLATSASENTSVPGGSQESLAGP